VVELIRSQWPDLAVSRCPLEDVRAEAGRISHHFTDKGVLVVDAETDADLAAIALAVLASARRLLPAGSAGLARALAFQLLGVPERLPQSAQTAGPVLAVLASSSERLSAQISFAAARDCLSPIALPCRTLSRAEGTAPELEGAIAAAGEQLAAGRDAIVYAVGPLPEVEKPIELVVEHLAHLAFVLVKQKRPLGLLVGGGATAQAVLETLGAESIEIDDEPLPGLAAGLLSGGHLSGRPIAFKPGAAGHDEAVVELLGYLRRRAAAEEELA
jgi:uncharacterized protein YgbK (DUF1537 family)